MARPLCAYAPDPEVTPPVQHSDFHGGDLPVVTWQARRPTPLMHAVRMVIGTAVALFAAFQLLAWLS